MWNNSVVIYSIQSKVWNNVFQQKIHECETFTKELHRGVAKLGYQFRLSGRYKRLLVWLLRSGMVSVLFSDNCPPFEKPDYFTACYFFTGLAIATKSLLILGIINHYLALCEKTLSINIFFSNSVISVFCWASYLEQKKYQNFNFPMNKNRSKNH